MSSVPDEILWDILQPLDRWTLDDVQFTDRRFLQLIVEHMATVCLLQVAEAWFQNPHHDPLLGYWRIDIDVSQTTRWTTLRSDAARLFSDFVQALRSSRVASLSIRGKYISVVYLDGCGYMPTVQATSALPFIAESLRLNEGSCAEITATQSSCTSRRLNCSSISDEFLRALSKNRVRRTDFRNLMPVDGGNFDVTDDAIVNFCMDEDVQMIDQGREQQKGLCLHHCSVTKNLLKRLVEASSVSMRTQPLRITVAPLHFEDVDLRDYAQHLSYRKPRPFRIYDFPGEQRGEVADAAFYESDE